MRKLGTDQVVIATTNARVFDEAMGITRKIVAGQPVPPELVDAYTKDGGETTPQGEQRPPGAVIAHETMVVHDDTMGIDRKLIGGQPVPPDLVDAYRQAAGEKPEPEPEPEPDGDDPPRVDYEKAKKGDLETEVDRRREAGRDITVEGTGQSGNVIAADLVRALEADDAAAAAEGD